MERRGGTLGKTPGLILGSRMSDGDHLRHGMPNMEELKSR